MASPIKLIDEFTISTTVTNVTIAGGSSASSNSGATMTGYDIYMLRWMNVDLNVDNRHVNFQLTASGSPQLDSSYDSYGERTRGASFTDIQVANNTMAFLDTGQDVADTNVSHGIAYIFHANDATKYTSVLVDGVGVSYNPYLQGILAGTIFKKLEAHDGIYILNSAGSSFQSGTFKLYGIET